MTNRTLARRYGEDFEALAAHPTKTNKRKAQQLYEKNFCTPPYIGSHRSEDFHIGETGCIDALRTLDVHRHPEDVYLATYGGFKVMKPRGGAGRGQGAPKGNKNAVKTEHKVSVQMYAQRMEPHQKAAIKAYMKEHSLTQKEALYKALRALGIEGF